MMVSNREWIVLFKEGIQDWDIIFNKYIDCQIFNYREAIPSHFSDAYAGYGMRAKTQACRTTFHQVWTI